MISFCVFLFIFFLLIKTKIEFDEIRDRLDMLTQKQNEHLKEIASNSIKSKKHLSAVKTATDISSQSSRSASPSVKSSAFNQSRVTKLKEPLSSSSSEESSSTEDEKSKPKIKFSNDNEVWKKTLSDHSINNNVEKSSSISGNNSIKALVPKVNDTSNNDSYEDDFNTSKSSSK
jgi:hypothetical protein